MKSARQSLHFVAPLVGKSGRGSPVGHFELVLQERMSYSIWSCWPRWRQAWGGHWFVKFGAYTDLVEFIPFFFLIHPRFNGGIGILYMTVRHVCRCVFRLGQNALRCSAIVDEERLPFVFLKVHFTHMCIYFFYAFWEMGGVVRRVVGLFFLQLFAWPFYKDVTLCNICRHVRRCTIVFLWWNVGEHFSSPRADAADYREIRCVIFYIVRSDWCAS